jgi:cellulose synthase/poly-beta-1,6-N-acetylglucosamine synthase-like glycosyltransferase
MTLTTQERVIVLIPVFNESPETIKKILNELMTKTNYDVLLGNDGSVKRDLLAFFDSLENSGNNRVFVLKSENNEGQGSIIRKMTTFATLKKYNVFVTFDGDGQHRVIDLVSGMDEYRKGSYDCMIGSRFIKSCNRPVNMPISKYFMLRILLWYFKNVYGYKVTDPQNGLRIFNRDFAKKVMVNLKVNGYGHTNEILHVIFKEKLKFGEFYTFVLYEKKESIFKIIKQIFQIILLNE